MVAWGEGRRPTSTRLPAEQTLDQQGWHHQAGLWIDWRDVLHVWQRLQRRPAPSGLSTTGVKRATRERAQSAVEHSA